MITPLMTSKITLTMVSTPLKPKQRAYTIRYAQCTIIAETPQCEYEGGEMGGINLPIVGNETIGKTRWSHALHGGIFPLTPYQPAPRIVKFELRSRESGGSKTPGKKRIAQKYPVGGETNQAKPGTRTLIYHNPQ